MTPRCICSCIQFPFNEASCAYEIKCAVSWIEKQSSFGIVATVTSRSWMKVRPLAKGRPVQINDHNSFACQFVRLAKCSVQFLVRFLRLIIGRPSRPLKTRRLRFDKFWFHSCMHQPLQGRMKKKSQGVTIVLRTPIQAIPKRMEYVSLEN